MKMFVLGVPCSGKSTLCKFINSSCGIRAIDVDDEILRLNDGVWPEIAFKNTVLFPQVMDFLMSTDEVLVFNSFLGIDDAEALRAADFAIALLAVGAGELKRRHEERRLREGWSNVEWFEWNQAAVRELERSGFVDEVIDAERPVESIASDIVAFFQ